MGVTDRRAARKEGMEDMKDIVAGFVRAALQEEKHPWKDHPLGIHFALLKAQEASGRFRQEMEGHFKECLACRLSAKALRVL